MPRPFAAVVSMLIADGFPVQHLLDDRRVVALTRRLELALSVRHLVTGLLVRSRAPLACLHRGRVALAHERNRLGLTQVLQEGRHGLGRIAVVREVGWLDEAAGDPEEVGRLRILRTHSGKIPQPMTGTCLELMYVVSSRSAEDAGRGNDGEDAVLLDEPSGGRERAVGSSLVSARRDVLDGAAARDLLVLVGLVEPRLSCLAHLREVRRRREPADGDLAVRDPGRADGRRRRCTRRSRGRQPGSRHYEDCRDDGVPSKPSLGSKLRIGMTGTEVHSPPRRLEHLHGKWIAADTRFAGDSSV